MPPTPIARRLSAQSLLFATGDGAFVTASAVFLTQLVGLTAAQVGLALTIAGVAELALAYPAGRLVDRVGPQRMWALTAVLRTGCFVLLPFVASFGQYVLLALAFALLDTTGKSANRAYVIDVLAPAERVRTQAHLYSALNLGFTLGALVGGVALAVGGEALRWAPLLSAALLAANAACIVRLPRAHRGRHPGARAPRREPTGPGPLRNPGWRLTSFFMGVISTHQVLLKVVIPLWLVEATDAPHVLLAWLYATNTVLCILLPAATSRGVRTLEDALRHLRWSGAFFLAACLVTAATHSTVGLATVALVWLGHVAVTGAELASSAAMWSLQSELMEPSRRGEYQGVQEVFGGLGSRWAPALYTFLALEVGGVGWLAIAAIVGVATLGVHPSARAAQRFAHRHWSGAAEVPPPTEGVVASAGPEPASGVRDVARLSGPLPSPR